MQVELVPARAVARAGPRPLLLTEMLLLRQRLQECLAPAIGLEVAVELQLYQQVLSQVVVAGCLLELVAAVEFVAAPEAATAVVASAALAAAAHSAVESLVSAAVAAAVAAAAAPAPAVATIEQESFVAAALVAAALVAAAVVAAAVLFAALPSAVLFPAASQVLLAAAQAPCSVAPEAALKAQAAQAAQTAQAPQVAQALTVVLLLAPEAARHLVRTHRSCL